MPKEIPLTRGLVAVVDDCDYDAVSAFKWYADKGANTFYARRNIGHGTGKQRGQKMQHFILGLGRIDHRDGDGLNNRRSNLRFCTRSQNAANSPKRRGRSRFKGVVWHKIWKKWTAAIHKDKKLVHLGYFRSEEGAARAYDAKAKEVYGEFAWLNFPEGA